MTKMSGIILVMSVGIFVGACAPTTIGSNWGTAYQDMRAKQVLNPKAGEQLDPVEGQDGKANAIAMEAYRRNFEKPDAAINRSVVSSGIQTK
jgi:hypothetical protein